MIALDTNVLVRLAVEDDAEQWQRAQDLVQRCIDHDERCLVNLQVLCELVWVVRSSYRASREDQALLLQALLDDEIFEIEDRRVVEALAQFRQARGGFVDYLIGVRNHGMGASTTYTFDGDLSGTDGFTTL